MRNTELRVGNRILYKGEEIVVTMIGLYGIQSRTETKTVNAKFSTPDLTGVPLTSERIINLGFEGEDNEYKKEAAFDTYYAVLSPNNLWTLYLAGVVDVTAGHKYFGLNPICDTFTFVHQLQNLYFELTREEL